jgi:hypothetical protein
MTPEQEAAIAELRSRNLPPKLIARQLGLRPAEVSAVIQAKATEVSRARAAGGELPPVFQCLVNKGCLANLLPAETVDQQSLTTSPKTQRTEDFGAGFAAVMIARQLRFNQLAVSGYLVDYWCLGVKDTLGPKQMNVADFNLLANTFFSRFPDGEVETISLELAQAIVWGGVAYAESLGFQPHRDFAQARELLGQSSTEQLHLTFGRNGKPCYFQGPYDDVGKIIKTLKQRVGEGNFDFVMQAGQY